MLICLSALFYFSSRFCLPLTGVESFDLSDFFDTGSSTKDFKGSSNTLPTFLTPYLDHGVPVSRIQKIAKLTPLVNSTPAITSYAGFLTVNRKFKSNLYFWFSPSERSSNDPLVLWLQGGPGDTFFSSFFNGNGPYALVPGNPVKIEKCTTSWTSDFNMLWIESPVGAGFSFAPTSAGYSKTLENAAENVYTALTQFLQIFPHLRANRFFIAGESYAGKFGPAVADFVWRQNEKCVDGSGRIRVDGLFIGCGFVDPVNQLHYADYFHQLGIIDEKTRGETEETEKKVREELKKGNYYRAEARLVHLLFTSAAHGHMPPIDALNMKMDHVFYGTVREVIKGNLFRDLVNLGNAEFHGKVQVWWNFKKDILRSASSYISHALKRSKVMLYAGQFDLLVPPVQIEKVISNLNFTNMEQFYNSRREAWYVKDEIAGYIKKFENLSSAVVRKSNHFILHSQPDWIKDLFMRFVHDNWEK